MSDPPVGGWRRYQNSWLGTSLYQVLMPEATDGEKEVKSSEIESIESFDREPRKLCEFLGANGRIERVVWR